VKNDLKSSINIIYKITTIKKYGGYFIINETLLMIVTSKLSQKSQISEF